MQTRRHVVVAAVLAAALQISTAAHADPAADVRAVRETGLVLHDGKGHYFAFGVADPAAVVGQDGHIPQVLYYGDGKTFYRQPVNGSEQEPKDLHTEWPIVDQRMGMELDLSKFFVENGAYSMKCRDKVTPLNALDPKDARKLLAKAAFKPILMNRQAFALGRDGTTYYLVDGRVLPETPDWRVFVGKRGALKQLKLKDIATDSDGLVFSSASGTLKVTKRPPAATTWEPKPGKQVALTNVPVDANLSLVYSDLGVYTQRFGVPCDDL